MSSPAAPARKSSLGGKILPGAILLATFLVGTAIGASGDDAPAAAPAPAAPVTVTATAPAPPAPPAATETTTVEKRVEVTPKACQEFSDSADRLIQLLASGYDLAAEGIQQAGNQDASGLDRTTSKIEDLTDDVTEARDDYNTDQAACNG